MNIEKCSDILDVDEKHISIFVLVCLSVIISPAKVFFCVEINL